MKRIVNYIRSIFNFNTSESKFFQSLIPIKKTTIEEIPTEEEFLLLILFKFGNYKFIDVLVKKNDTYYKLLNIKLSENVNFLLYYEHNKYYHMLHIYQIEYKNIVIYNMFDNIRFDKFSASAETQVEIEQILTNFNNEIHDYFNKYLVNQEKENNKKSMYLNLRGIK